MSKDDLKRVTPKYPNQELRVTLPLAVSINHLYTHLKGKKFMNKQGLQYMKDVGLLAMHKVKEQGYVLEEEGVWLVCELTYYFPDKRVRDCHNMHKLVADALEHIAFVNDRWVLMRDMYVGLDKDRPRIEVRIRPQVERD